MCAASHAWWNRWNDESEFYAFCGSMLVIFMLWRPNVVYSIMPVQSFWQIYLPNFKLFSRESNLNTETRQPQFHFFRFRTHIAQMSFHLSDFKSPIRTGNNNETESYFHNCVWLDAWQRMASFQATKLKIFVFLFSTWSSNKRNQRNKTRIRNYKHLFAITAMVPLKSITFASKFTTFLNRQMSQGERTFANGFLIFQFFLHRLFERRWRNGFVALAPYALIQ